MYTRFSRTTSITSGEQPQRTAARFPRGTGRCGARAEKTLNVDVFGAADGIWGSSDFNFGYHPSACKLRDGTLWFPTTAAW